MSTPSNQINWGNYQGSTRTFDPFVAAASQPDPNEGVGALDYVKHFTSEAVNLTTSVGWLAAKGVGADNIAEQINDLGRVATDYWHDSMSEDAQQAAAADMVRKTEDGSGVFGYEWADPSLHTVGLAAAGSLFGTGVGMGGGALATKGLTKMMQVFGNPAGRKVLETAIVEGGRTGATQAAVATGVQASRKLKLIAGVTGAVGFGVGEGAISGVSTTKSVYDQIMSLDHDKLLENPRYQMVFDSADGMDELERHKYAADTVAFEAGTEAGIKSGFTTSLLGAPMGAYFGRLLGGNLTRKMASTIPRGIASAGAGEAGQEFLQSGSEQIFSNLARQPFEPDLDTWDNVLNSAIGGALAGFVLGGATGPLAVGQQKKANKIEDQQEADRVQKRIGGELRGAAEAATEAGVDRRHTSDVLDRLMKNDITPGEAIIEIKTLERDKRKGTGMPPLPADRDDIDYGPGDKAQEARPVPTTAAPKKDSVEEYRQKARTDFEQYGVSDRNRASVVEALNQNVGEDAAAAYDKTYQELVDQAVEKRQAKKPNIQPVRPRPKTIDEIVSRSPDELEAATALISSRPKGAEKESFAGSTPVKTQYQLTEASDLIPSHTADGQPVPIYPTELQPRDRSRAASKEWITDKAANFRPELLTEGPGLAEGAPLISGDGIVESGNGRVMLLNHIYDNNPEAAAQYKTYLKDNAASFGLTAEQVEGMDRPILARTRLDKMSGKQLQELTQAANVTETASLSPVEQANVDAGNITDDDLAGFSPDESGNVLAAGNDSFVKAFLGRMTAAERGKVMTPAGQPTKQLADRIQSAIFAKAYADDRVLALMAEDTNPDVKNIVNALTKAAPAFARARAGGELGDLNIVDPLLDAVEVVRAARNKGLEMSEYQAQGDLLGDTDPLVNALATFLDKNIRSPKRMAEAMSQMGAFIEKEVDSKKNASLFGQERDIGLADVIEAADRFMTEKYGDTASVATGLRGETAAPAAAPGLPATVGGAPVEVMSREGGAFVVKDADGTTRTVPRADITPASPKTAGKIDKLPGESFTDVLKKANTAPASAPASLFVEFNGEKYPVDSLEDASAKWSQVRTESGVASSEVSGVQVTDSAGNVVAKIAYNGKIQKTAAAAPKVETVQLTEKGIERMRKDPRIKKYLPAKRPIYREVEQMVGYRTEAVLGLNTATEAGADQDVIDFLKTEYDYALKALETMRPAVDWRNELGKGIRTKVELPKAFTTSFNKVIRAHQLLGKAWQRESKTETLAKHEATQDAAMPELISKIEALTPEQLQGARDYLIGETRDPKGKAHDWGIPSELERPLGLISGPTIAEASVGDTVEVWNHSDKSTYKVRKIAGGSALVESIPNTPNYTFGRMWIDSQSSAPADRPNPRRGQTDVSNLADTYAEAEAKFDEQTSEEVATEKPLIAESLQELTEQESWEKLQKHYGLEGFEMDDLRKVIASSPWVTQEGEQSGLEFRMELEQVVSNYADGLVGVFGERMQGDDYRAYFHNKGFDRAQTYPLTDTERDVLEGNAPLDLKTKPADEIFPKPDQRFHASKVATEVLSAEEGAARVQEWKDEAARIGREEDHSQEVILSLFDHSGRWSQPYADAGYDVRRYDYFDGDDLLLFAPTGDIIDIHTQGKKVVGVLAACPCTSFSASGARWWKTQHDVPTDDMVAKKFGEAAAKHFDTPLEYSQMLVEVTKVMIEMTDPQFHVLENPRGRIARMTGINDPRLTFDPNNYGDPYTKETKLWGEFNAELPQANVEPTEGSLIHSLRGDVPEQKALRSLTPEGFAYAFFMANSTATKPAETAPTTEQETLFSRTPNANQGDMFGPTPEMNPVQPQAPTDTRPMVDTLTADQVEAELEQFEKQRVRIAQQHIRDRVSPMFAAAGNRHEYGTKDNDLRVAALHNRASTLQSQETLTQRGMFKTDELHGYNVLFAKLRRAGKNPERDMTLQQLKSLDAEPVAKKGIQDLGEKIGGARKDLAAPGRPRGQGKGTGPAWMRKYHVLPETAKGSVRAVNIMSFIDKENYPIAGDQDYTGTWALFREGGGFGSRKIKGGFPNKAEAEAGIPLAEVIRKHGVGPTSGKDTFEVYRRVTKRKTIPVKGGFESRDAAMIYIATNPLEVLAFRPATPERPHLEELERYGLEDRKGDITPDKFMGEFGFRGAEFGNWLPQDERQEVLNRAYDALMDMANVLQVPPKALSLNGGLAIGFGSRGQGLGKAKAHFELDKNVINLTRIRGAGSLAHEWFHAFDAYLAKQDTKAGDKFYEGIDRATGKKVQKKYRKSKARGKEDSFVSFGFSYDSKTRDELRAAFTKVNKTIRRRQKEFDKNIDQLEKFATRYEMQMLRELQDIERELGQTLDSKYYKRKNKPGTPAQMKKIKALSVAILDGKPGKESYVQGKGWRGRNTFEAVEEISKIYKDIRGRTGFREHGRLTKLLGTISGKQRADTQVELAKKVNKETRTVSTDYYSEAAKLDRSRVGDYYSTPHELGARAFESFMYDAFAANEARSDYLVHSVTNDLYMPGVNPYPEAEERTAISASFAELFDTIKAAAPDAEGNVALFSRSGATGKPLGSVRMTETAMIEETGELVEIESDAATLLRQVDQRIANIEKVGECLRS